MMSASEVKSFNDDLTSSLKSIDRSDPDALEKFLQLNATVLPEEHYLAREIQYALVRIYKVELAHLLDNHQLLRKSYLCKEN